MGSARHRKAERPKEDKSDLSEVFRKAPRPKEERPKQKARGRKQSKGKQTE